jgi:iron complex transport system substrate-binding protein
MLRHFRFRFAIIAALFFLCCLQQSRSWADYPLEYRDALGTNVRIEVQPRRIISLMPSITESLFYIGAGPQIIGATKYCNYPEAAKKIPRIGDLNLNYERILSLNPDLILGDPVLISKSLEKLRGMNLKVVAIRTQKVSEIMTTLRVLGNITGHSREANEAARKMEESVAQIVNRTSRLARPRVFLEVWDKPLMTVGGDAFLGELIAMAGGQNIAQDVTRAWAQISEEVVIHGDPEVLLLLTGNKDAYAERPEWKQVSAIRKGRVYELDRDLYSQPSPRLVLALQQLAQLIHPEINEPSAKDLSR